MFGVPHIGWVDLLQAYVATNIWHSIRRLLWTGMTGIMQIMTTGARGIVIFPLIGKLYVVDPLEIIRHDWRMAEAEQAAPW